MHNPLSNYKAARMLGWTSLVIGVTELAATRWLESQMGVSARQRGVIRALGVREIATGAAILNEPGVTTKLSAGLWARVAGDVLDLAMLGKAVPGTRNPKGLSAIIGLVLAATGLDIFVAARVQHELTHANVVARQARGCVSPTRAMPKGAPVINADATQREEKQEPSTPSPAVA